MEYFGHDHLPYAVFAIFMFTTFNLVLFLLLCLCSCQCVQSCLNCCRLNSEMLCTFMDAFQGYYKFEPYDCRYWTAFYLSLRIALLSIFGITQSGYGIVMCGILLILTTMISAIVKPYRIKVYNIIGVGLLSVFIQILFSAAGRPFGVFTKQLKGFKSLCSALVSQFP